MAKNVVTKVENGHLHIDIDLSQTFGKSASGKSVIIASTEGSPTVQGHDNIKFGLNVYQPV